MASNSAVGPSIVEKSMLTDIGFDRILLATTLLRPNVVFTTA